MVSKWKWNAPFFKNRMLSFFLLWMLFFGLALLFRLPHLLSRNSFFDGDEAIIGIMAKDLLAFRQLPIYFYGQNYGLSIFEVFTTAFWIKIVGVGIWALRLGGLTLFSLGILFFYKGLLVRNYSQKLAFIFVLVLLSFPTWMLWGMMVRGGYVTSFAAIAFVYFRLGKTNFQWKHLLVLGLGLAISFEAQSFILLPALPLFLRDWWNRKGTWKSLLLGVGFTLVWILFFNFIDRNQPIWGNPGMDLNSSIMLERYNLYMEGFTNAFSNFFYFNVNHVAPFWWRKLVIFALILITFLTVWLFFQLSKKDKYYFALWFLTMIILFAVLGVFIAYSPRYLIAFFTGFLFLFLFFADYLSKNKVLKIGGATTLVVFLIGIGVGSKMIRDFYELELNYMDSLTELHTGVVKEQKKAVFACDVFINWQWNYLYGDEIPSTSFSSQDRISRFCDNVDYIYQTQPNRTAIIGFEGSPLDLHKLEGFSDSDYKIGTRYFIQPIVTPAYHAQGFEKMWNKYTPIDLKKR